MVEMRLNSEPFDKISKGQKTIEMRLFDEKRALLHVGDEIVFINRDDFSKKIYTKIVALHKFKNFDELYKHFDKFSLGYNDNEIANPQDMEKYYSKDEQKKYGVVGIEIRLEK